MLPSIVHKCITFCKLFYLSLQLVSHYTYALTLSAIGELDGCALHLRWVLMHDIKFPGALEYLRTVRCYVKFERERVELEKQVN